MIQLVDIVVKFYEAEGNPVTIAAVVEAVAAVLSIDDVRLTRDGDDDILLISAGRLLRTAQSTSSERCEVPSLSPLHNPHNTALS